MMIDESIVNLGIVVIGGLVLVAGVFFIIKSTPRKSAAGNGSTDNAGPGPGRQEKVVAENKKKHKDKSSFFSKLREKMSKGLGSKVKDQPSPAGQPEPASNERGASRMPDLSSLGLQTNDLHSLAERETLNTVPVDEVESTPELPPAPPEDSAPVPDTEPPLEEENIVSANNDAPAGEEDSLSPNNDVPVGEEDSVSPNGDLPGEETPAEPEPTPEEAEVPVMETPVEETPDENAQSKSDDLFDMFKDELAVESEASKFAANLDDIDVHDLLEESQSLINYLSGNSEE